MMLEYKEITKKDLKQYRNLILPMVYEELKDSKEMDTEYISIATIIDGTPRAAIIAEPEGSGDINLLSIWTDQDYRNLGVASALLDQMLNVALHLYDWDEGQFGDDITLKTMYCLTNKYRIPFEQWLQKKDFTDFCILHPEDNETPEICSATAEVHFYRM